MLTNTQRLRIRELHDALAMHPPGAYNTVLGFDGFVDEIVHVVDKRINPDEFIRLTSMKSYGERISKSAGLSTNIEMVTIQQKLGGNGTIFANALIELGFDVTYIGALGEDSIHPVFHEMSSRCKAISLSDPARTDAIEFFDGKIISSKLQPFNQITWQALLEKLGLDELVRMLDESELIGFENWTMLLHMSDIWKNLLSEVMPRLTARERKRMLFIDIADPEKRSDDDVLEALSLMGSFSSYCDVILGLNMKEASEIAVLLGLPSPGSDAQGLRALAESIFSRMNIASLLIHPLKEACAITNNEYYHVYGPYCEKPVLTTGAGDHFNAGCVTGMMMGLPVDGALLLGTATSGYYVRHGVPPDWHGLMAFLRQWADGALD